MEYRLATPDDARVLATMNHDLIWAEGHRNRMTPPELERRMAGWLAGEYRAAVFKIGGQAVGYSLFRGAPEYVYLRQFYVRPDFRRRGVGRRALDWLRHHAWADGARSAPKS